MISKKDFVSFSVFTLDFFTVLQPLLKDEDAETFFENISEIRAIHKSILSDFDNYQMYPRADITEMNSNIPILVDYCEKTDIKIIFQYDLDKFQFNEENWSTWRRADRICNFFYKGLILTKFIEL